MGTLLYLIIIASAAFVYWDATKNRIGKTSDAKTLTNSPAWLWALGVLLLWIVAFPLYLVKRKELIQKAKENPVDVPGKQKKIVLGVLGGFLVILLVGGLFGGNNKAPSPFPNLPIPSLAQAQGAPLIQAVKDAVFERVDASMTIGQAIDNNPHFQKVKWSSRKEGARQIVEAKCYYRTGTKAWNYSVVSFKRNFPSYGDIVEATCRIIFTVNVNDTVELREFRFIHKCTLKEYSRVVANNELSSWKYVAFLKGLYNGKFLDLS